MDELVKGVTFLKAGTALEHVKLRNTDSYLLSSWDGTEIVRQEVPAGKRFGLHPDPEWNALEHIYVVEGKALWESDGRRVVLGPGDSVSGTPVQAPLIFTALTRLVFLYITSQPAFHLVSKEIRHLQQLAVSVEQRDGYTVDHSRRIRELSVQVGRYLGLRAEQQYHLFHGAFLHDLGKVDVPDSVLLKPGKLTYEEWQVMKQHPVTGAQRLQSSPVAGAAFILEQHHERLDGSGYPYGLRGDEISVEAQIVAVVDSYDAMTTDRVYRPRMLQEEALAELRRGVGQLYRGDVVEAFLDVLTDERAQNGVCSD